MAMQEGDNVFGRKVSIIQEIDPRESPLEDLVRLAQACVFGPGDLSISICKGKAKVEIPIPETLAIVPLDKRQDLVLVIACAMCDADRVIITKPVPNFYNPPSMNN